MEFEFTNETIEKLIVKRMLSDKKILGSVSGFFDQRIFENRPVGVLAKLSVAYFRKYDSTPTNRIISALSKKYCETRDDVGEDDLASALLDIQSLGIDIGSQIARENCQMYLKKKLAYLTICDTANDVIKTGDVGSCFDRLDKTMKITFEDKDLGMSYFSEEDMKEHWEFITNPNAKLKTGWEGLDRITNGGFLKDGKMIACFMGQAGLGKSLFLSNIAVNFLKQNLGVVVISLEMSENVYSQRFDAHISKLNINRLKDNSQEAMSRIRVFHESHPESSLIVKEYPPRSVKCSEIENYLDNLKASGAKIDVIIIDYLNLILPNNRTDSMYSGIMEVVERLRTISYKFEAPVITATQANRQGMNNENINMEHVSESGGIAHTVDFMGGLYQMDEDREHGIINMRVIKNRFGGAGSVIPFHMDPENLVLEDSSGRTIGSGTRSEADEILNNLPSISADMNDAL